MGNGNVIPRITFATSDEESGSMFETLLKGATSNRSKAGAATAGAVSTVDALSNLFPMLDKNVNNPVTTYPSGRSMNLNTNTRLSNNASPDIGQMLSKAKQLKTPVTAELPIGKGKALNWSKLRKAPNALGGIKGMGKTARLGALMSLIMDISGGEKNPREVVGNALSAAFGGATGNALINLSRGIGNKLEPMATALSPKLGNAVKGASRLGGPALMLASPVA